MSKASGSRVPLVDRVARVAFTFFTMNCSAVAGLFAAITGRKVWK
jgi:hypothetical protein